MKKLLCFLVLLLILAAPLRSVAAPPLVAVVRVYDGGATVTAYIARGNASPEKVTFTSGISDKHLAETSAGYQQLIQRLYAEGYTLQATFRHGEVYATLVFVKPS